MKAMKFRINSPEHSKQIQEELFKLGYKWNDSGCNVCYTERPYLYTKGEVITHGTIKSFFDKDENIETTLQELQAMNNQTLQVSKDFVLQAHKSACDTWKKKIEEQFPEMFKEKTLYQLAKEFGFPVYDGYMELIEVDEDTIGISLPALNSDWTFVVWDWIKSFCEEHKNKEYTIAPMHKYFAIDENYQYLKRYN